MQFRDVYKSRFTAIHKIKPAAAMHMNVNETGRYIFSLRVYFKGIRQELGRRMQADLRATDRSLNWAVYS